MNFVAKYKWLITLIVVLAIILGAWCIVQKRAVAPTIDKLNFKTFTDSQTGFSFQYPEKFLTEYISADQQSWPPKVVATEGDFICNEGQTTPLDGMPFMVKKIKINGHEYCLHESSEGAAGTIYVTYIYITKHEPWLVSVKFTLRYPQCLNYDQPKQGECLTERDTFDQGGIVDRIVESLTHN